MLMSTSSLMRSIANLIWFMSLMSGPAHGCDNAELRGTGGRSFLGGFDQFRDVQPDAADGAVEEAGLAAEMAVFGAAAGLDGDDAFHLHVLAAMPEADLVRQLQSLRGVASSGRVEDLHELVFAEAHAPLQDLRAGCLQDGPIVDGGSHGWSFVSRNVPFRR